ncbi:unnamed protein product, partial [Amoebophrya sp. A120]
MDGATVLTEEHAVRNEKKQVLTHLHHVCTALYDELAAFFRHHGPRAPETASIRAFARLFEHGEQNRHVQKALVQVPHRLREVERRSEDPLEAAEQEGENE